MMARRQPAKKLHDVRDSVWFAICSCGKQTVLRMNRQKGKLEADDPDWKYISPDVGWTCGADGHSSVTDHDLDTAKAKRAAEDERRLERLWEKLSHANHLRYLMQDLGLDVSEWKADLQKDDDELPDQGLKAANSLIGHFYRLPICEQRRILNGWAPCRIIPRTEEVKEYLARVSLPSPYRVMELQNHQSFTRQVSAHHDYEIADTNADVRVIIREGTSKESAVHALQAVLREIEASWEKLVEDLPFDVKFERKLESDIVA